MSNEFPNVKHKGIKEPFSYSIVRKAVSELFPVPDGSPSNEGSSILGEFIYILFLGLFGRSVKPSGFSYKGTPEGDALFDSAKIIRILLYFFSNTIITVFFKDIETMYLNENHNIDDEFLGLGITLRQIHGSLTNGIISFIYSLALNNGMIGGGETSDTIIDINEVVKEFFVDVSFEEFETILMMNDNDPYELRKTKNKDEWNNSFSKVLLNSKTGKKITQKKNKDVEFEKIKQTINGLSDLKDSEINEIVELLDLKKTKKSYTKADDILAGGAYPNKEEFGPYVKAPPSPKSKYVFPGVEDSLEDQKKKGSNKYFFYKLYLLEKLFNSKKFLDSFEVMFNLLCRLINRLIKRLIPLIRKTTKNTINNYGAFIFSLGGPFTEILWFAFSSLLNLIDVGEATLNLTDDVADSVPVTGASGRPEFVESSILKGSEPDTLNELIGIISNLQKYSTYKGGGQGNKCLKNFDKKVKDSFSALF